MISNLNTEEMLQPVCAEDTVKTCFSFPMLFQFFPQGEQSLMDNHEMNITKEQKPTIKEEFSKNMPIL